MNGEHPNPQAPLAEDRASKRAKAKKYYVGREIGQLKARVAALEIQLANSRALVLERNRSLRGLEKGRDQLRKLLNLAKAEHYCGFHEDCKSPFCTAMRKAGEVK